ncbi:methyltransferase domain-containing protein [candidate division KSB1 bacterium]|nr:methyltransferase domain-containing protein [candidate division KSB1 bacterium]
MYSGPRTIAFEEPNTNYSCHLNETNLFSTAESEKSEQYQGDHWYHLANMWQFVGPPLRPTSEDTLVREQFVHTWCQKTGQHHPQCLLLGVTPEIVKMRWPPHSQILALDRNDEMIKHVYPGHSEQGFQVLQGDWTRLPVLDRQFDLILGDGCYVMFDYHRGFSLLSESIEKALKPNGQFIIRFFIRPEIIETSDQVFSDLLKGKICNFHLFKWRLAMAMHNDVETGVSLSKVWRIWEKMSIDSRFLADTMQWSIESIHTIQAYRRSNRRYTFPTKKELYAALTPYFRISQYYLPSYECGDRFPTLVLDRK